MPKITVDYCSKYSSFDGTSVTEGKVLAPVLISDAEYQSNNTIIPENLRTWKHYGVPFRVGFMVVDEADFNKMLSLYYSGINDYFEEHPELRPGRCVLGWDNEGFPILCSKENRCKGCPRRAEHLPRFKSREDFTRAVPDVQSTFLVSRAVRTLSSSHPSRIPMKTKTATPSDSTSRIPT